MKTSQELNSIDCCKNCGKKNECVEVCTGMEKELCFDHGCIPGECGKKFIKITQ